MVPFFFRLLALAQTLNHLSSHHDRYGSSTHPHHKGLLTHPQDLDAARGCADNDQQLPHAICQQSEQQTFDLPRTALALPAAPGDCPIPLSRADTPRVPEAGEKQRSVGRPGEWLRPQARMGAWARGSATKRQNARSTALLRHAARREKGCSSATRGATPANPGRWARPSHW